MGWDGESEQSRGRSRGGKASDGFVCLLFCFLCMYRGDPLLLFSSIGTYSIAQSKYTKRVGGYHHPANQPTNQPTKLWSYNWEMSQKKRDSSSEKERRGERRVHLSLCDLVAPCSFLCGRRQQGVGVGGGSKQRGGYPKKTKETDSGFCVL